MYRPYNSDWMKLLVYGFDVKHYVYLKIEKNIYFKFPNVPILKRYECN